MSTGAVAGERAGAEPRAESLRSQREAMTKAVDWHADEIIAAIQRGDEMGKIAAWKRMGRAIGVVT